MKMKQPITHWIWMPDWKEEIYGDCHLAYFRKVFQLETVPESCCIRVSADSRYKLYVNGSLAEIGPSRGDRQIWYCDEVELVPYLQQGENVLAVEVLRYPIAHQKGNHGIFRTETPGLYIKAKPQPGTEGLEISADHTWRCRLEKEISIISEAHSFAPLQILEERSGNPGNAGWKQVQYDDRSWQPAAVYNRREMSKAVSPGNLHPRTIPFMRKEARQFAGIFGNCETQISAADWNGMIKGKWCVRVRPHCHEIIELNAGELNTGYLSLRLVGGTGATIRILTSEGYVQKEARSKGAMALPVKGDRCDWENGYLHGFTDVYHVGGHGTAERVECYEPFWFRTFRFVRLEIKTAKEGMMVAGFDYQETGYPLKVKTRVQTSDDTLEAIWDISVRTLKRCMHETYEDCPFYEQLQYAMDSRSQILYTYVVAADDRLARKCMDDFRRSQRYDGMLNCSYPSYGPNVIPGFAIYYIMMLYDHMMYFGDKAFLRRHMSTVDSILEYFGRNLDKRGLVGKTGGLHGEARYWSFIDWTQEWDKTVGMPPAGMSGPLTMESLLYIMGLSHAGRVLQYLGRPEVAEEYARRARAVQKAVNRYCTDSDGVYVDGPGIMEYSQHCQIFALLTDTVSWEKGRELLRKTLTEKEHYVQCSVAMSYYLFRALEKTGLYEETNEAWDLWRDMVRKNLTTCVEDSVNERSDCHAWGALALYELPAVVLGVQPGAPGYEKILVNPVPGYHNWAKGEVATKWGMVSVEWQKKEDGSLDVHYELPLIKDSI